MKPLLATNAPEATQINYPVYASPKLDGIRCLIKEGVALSRTLKPIPNLYIQSVIGKSELNGLDGELIVGSPYAKNAMQASMSGVMSREGEPEFTYYAFDMWDKPDDLYSARLVHATTVVGGRSRCEILDPRILSGVEDLDNYEANCLSLGYEGVMLRSMYGGYKYGRSTVREGLLLKVKRFASGEARVIGYEPQYRNDNAQTRSATGNSVRSTHAENLVALDALGALTCVDIETGAEFGIGTGFDAAQRVALWREREALIGRLVTFKHFESGAKSAPRFPVFVSFRDPIDL